MLLLRRLSGRMRLRRRRMRFHARLLSGPRERTRTLLLRRLSGMGLPRPRLVGIRARSDARLGLSRGLGLRRRGLRFERIPPGFRSRLLRRSGTRLLRHALFHPLLRHLAWRVCRRPWFFRNTPVGFI